MKVSINLAQEYSNVDLKGISKNSMLSSIGSQLGAVEEVVEWGPKFDGVVVVRVVECDKHPNADKLKVCLIDDGGVVKEVKRDNEGFVQVVCGAPNVNKGMFVAWIPPKAIVPSTKGTSDEFVLDARELRGIVSNGMLASAHELGISDDHSGLLELNEENVGKMPVAGDAFSKYLGLDDLVIDCENKMFTHRPDCFGNLGVSRELSGINGLNFKSPDWYLNSLVNNQTSRLNFVSKNEITKLVPRFMAQVVEGVMIKPSALKVQVDLARAGLRALNNIVDYTNYFMHLTAQPTHAFDYDKIKSLSNDSPTIFPRMAKDGEELVLLNGKTIKLTKDDIVIATDKKAVALAGIMGGAETEVDDNTKNIIIECATFDMYSVRRTSMRHGIFSDAVTRFNKGQSPWQNDKVLAKLVSEIVKSTGAKAGKLIDIKDDKLHTQDPVKFNVDFINVRLGKQFSPEEVADLLRRTEFEVSINKQELIVTPPYWRMDIESPEDIVEEVGRLYGFSNLPMQLPTRKSVTINRNSSLSVKRYIANTLKSYGANEVLTYSFVHGDLLKHASQDLEDAYKIRNAISPELQYYRVSLTPSIAQHVHPNIKSGYDEFALFEIGKIHNKKYGLNEERVPLEKDAIAFVYSASDKASKNKDSAAYYTARYYLEVLLNELNIEFSVDGEGVGELEVSSPFNADRSAIVKSVNTGEVVGIVGEYSPVLREKLKLPKFSSGFELYLDILTKLKKDKKYQTLSKFPSTEQDLTVEIDKKIIHAEIEEQIQDSIKEQSRINGYEVRIIPLGVYSDNDTKKRVSFRFVISHHSKTLKTDEINTFIDKVASALSSKYNASRV